MPLSFDDNSVGETSERENDSDSQMEKQSDSPLVFSSIDWQRLTFGGIRVERPRRVMKLIVRYTMTIQSQLLKSDCNQMLRYLHQERLGLMSGVEIDMLLA